MSEIPFVNALGDAIERSAATSIAGRRRRIRRRLTGGVLAFAVAATGVAAASGVFETGTPEQLATTSIGCYSRADLKNVDVSVTRRRRARPRRGLPQHAEGHGADGGVRRPAGDGVPGWPRHVREARAATAAPGVPDRPRQGAPARAPHHGDRGHERLLAAGGARRAGAEAARWHAGVAWLPDARRLTSMYEGPCGSITHPDGDGRPLDRRDGRQREAPGDRDGGRLALDERPARQPRRHEPGPGVDRTLLRRRRRRGARPRSPRIAPAPASPSSSSTSTASPSSRSSRASTTAAP